MIDLETFIDLARDTPGVGRDLRDRENQAQLDALRHEGERLLMVAAGPGSGKTTVIVLRALRCVLVDGELPEHLLLTTFTKKAARELRTRWLDWGTAILGALGDRFDPRAIDLNRCRIDTLDSVAQQALADHKLPGTLAPIVAESATSKLMLKRFGFSDAYRGALTKESLDTLFSRYTFSGDPPFNQGEALEVAKRLSERLMQDRVSIEDYRDSGVAERHVVSILERYSTAMAESSVYDYTSLQAAFLERLRNGSLAEWLASVSVLMVDEYQDTNPLQEAIYFAIIAGAAPQATIVGDDDQAMYRFRGGSVELLTQFSSRAMRATGRNTLRLDMTRNFRSTPEIVRFYNNHIDSDPAFADARIAPRKPQVVASRGESGMPVLGMFRETPEELAAALSEFLSRLVSDRRVLAGGENDPLEITMAPGGDLGDAVLLCHSVGEARYNRARGTVPEEVETRFVGLLRRQLAENDRHIFNPGGQALRLVPSVRLLLGLLVLCVDPDGSATREVFPTREAQFFLNLWRRSAEAFVRTNPQPADEQGLPGFVARWQDAAAGTIQPRFPRDWPALELVFTLITWIPAFHSDPEHQVWLEAITRLIGSVATASPYEMKFLQNVVGQADQMQNVRRSRMSFIRDALLPIAENEIEVDEEIMPSVPRDRLQVMTIHQAKGLEFPLVVVDVGAHFRSNHEAHRFLRHPLEVSNVVRMEDDIEPFLESPLRGGRSALDRTFDDLVRLYYVACSRPQSVLLLVGNEQCLKFGSGRNLDKSIVPHVALGWNRDMTWPWRQPFQGKPPTRVNPPFRLI
ncbi:MAG: DEAD/DEAH box helicase [Fimbriimonadaceae bacterium]